MAYSLKLLIDQDFIQQLASLVAKQDRRVKAPELSAAIMDKTWKNLELKQRIRKVTIELQSFIPGTYPQQLELLKRIAPEFKGLAALVFPDFVEVYGLEHWDESVEALKFFTPYSTSEFAIRPFIDRQPQKMFPILLKWSKDKDPHVRRLSSEGCRPLLPWSFKLRALVTDPSPILPILENLKADESIYVRKSVANSLNDISKHHPELVLDLAKKWKGQNPNTDWIIKHALRTLLKRGDQRALKLFGVGGTKKVKVEGFSFSKKTYDIGGRLDFSFEIHNGATSSQNLRVEYAIHYLKKNGKHSKKVFKLAEREFTKGRQTITRGHSLKQMTTRKHYPGEHHLEVIINGQPQSKKSFRLK